MDTKDKLFKALERFLRQNVSLVADTRDSNAPWNLLDRLDRFKEKENRFKEKEKEQ